MAIRLKKTIRSRPLTLGCSGNRPELSLFAKKPLKKAGDSVKNLRNESRNLL